MANCKPGDIAIVVMCRNAPENVGAIRTVIEPDGWGWVVSPALPNGDECICDTCLRPIRPPSDDITTTAPAELDDAVAWG